MANKRQKPPDQLQDRRPSRVDEPLALPVDSEPAAAAIEIPRAPTGMLASSRKKWELFWLSPLRQYVIQIDRLLVERYFRTLDINERAYKKFMDQPYDEGSTKQQRASPAWQVFRESSRLLDTLEDQLGIGMRARMHLNILLGEAAEGLADFLAALRRPSESDGPGETYTIDQDGNFVDD